MYVHVCKYIAEFEQGASLTRAYVFNNHCTQKDACQKRKKNHDKTELAYAHPTNQSELGKREKKKQKQKNKIHLNRVFSPDSRF